MWRDTRRRARKWSFFVFFPNVLQEKRGKKPLKAGIDTRFIFVFLFFSFGTSNHPDFFISLFSFSIQCTVWGHIRRGSFLGHKAPWEKCCKYLFSSFLLIYIKLSSSPSVLVSAQRFCPTFLPPWCLLSIKKKKKITKTDSLQSALPLTLLR